MVHKIKSHMSKDQATASGVSLEWFYLNQEVGIQAGMTLREYTKADEVWVVAVVGKFKKGISVAKALDSLEIAGWTAVVRQSKKGKKAKLARPRRNQHDMAWLPKNGLWQAVHRMQHSHCKIPFLGGALQEVFLACWGGIQG